MQGLNEFIVEIGKAFQDTIKHGSLELYTEYCTKQHEQSNRKGSVISLPMQIASDVLEGAKVIIDPTILFQQTYRGKTQKSQYLVNEEKGWYRLSPDMILLYKNPGQTEWCGHKENLFVKPLKPIEKKSKAGIVNPFPEKQINGVAEVCFSNQKLREEESIGKGDIIFYPKKLHWPFEIEGEQYLYLRNIDILGKRI